jgi:hypothetical protein
MHALVGQVVQSHRLSKDEIFLAQAKHAGGQDLGHFA